MPRDWDAATYERVSGPIAAMGLDVLARLELDGDETVLDAGCGTGRVTQALAQRLPTGRVIAVDGSPAMVAEARRRLPGTVDVQQQDLLELTVEEPVDAIVSTATFHWIGDHDRLFARLHDALKPGGRLVAQCGGEGNIRALKDAGFAVAARPPFDEHLGGWPGDWNFATVADTERRLHKAGFTDVWCWRTRVDVQPEDPAAFLGSITLGSFLARLPEHLHDDFVERVDAELEHPLTAQYVRLNILARRAI